MPERMQFENVTAIAKANLYFEGNVVSHTIHLANGERKTLGVIKPGSYRFDTHAAELMEIIDGSCDVTLEGSETKQTHAAGSSFNVPAQSAFNLQSPTGCQYVCSYL